MLKSLVFVGRVVGATLPITLAFWATVSAAMAATQPQPTPLPEENRRIIERYDERFNGLHAEITELRRAQNATANNLWWLAIATAGSATVSGAVGVDRAVWKRRIKNGII